MYPDLDARVSVYAPLGPELLDYAGFVAQSSQMANVQIFGMKNSQPTRAAERFFKERRVPIQFVDLNQRPMAPAEIKRFVDRFGLPALLDTEGSAYIDGGIKYLKLTDAELLAKIERDPRLLRMPLVRSANRIGIGHDEESWNSMLATIPIPGAGPRGPTESNF